MSEVEQRGFVSGDLLGHPALQVIRPHATSCLVQGLRAVQEKQAAVSVTAQEHFARSVYDCVGELDSSLASLRLVSAFLQEVLEASDPDVERYRYHYENFLIRGIGVVDRAYLLVADSLMLSKKDRVNKYLIEIEARSHPLVQSALGKVKALFQPYRRLRNRVAHESAYSSRDLNVLAVVRQVAIDVAAFDMPAIAREALQPEAIEVAQFVESLQPALEHLLAALAPIYVNVAGAFSDGRSD